MFLQDKQTGDMVEILDAEALFSPTEPDIAGRVQTGQEEQEPTSYPKASLIFPSGESLPRCWTDPDYRTAGEPGQ